ncbi:hypothetical protein V5O39_31040 [Pseudomonas parakoreensis]
MQSLRLLIRQPALKVGLFFEAEQRLWVRGQVKQQRFLQLKQQRAVQAQPAFIDTIEYRLRDPQIRRDLARRVRSGSSLWRCDVSSLPSAVAH